MGRHPPPAALAAAPGSFWARFWLQPSPSSEGVGQLGRSSSEAAVRLGPGCLQGSATLDVGKALLQRAVKGIPYLGLTPGLFLQCGLLFLPRCLVLPLLLFQEGDVGSSSKPLRGRAGCILRGRGKARVLVLSVWAGILGRGVLALAFHPLSRPLS